MGVVMLMARKGGGGVNIAEAYIRVGLNIILLGAVGITVVVILASVLGNITSKFPVESTNPLYSVTQAWETAVTDVTGFISPLLLMGIAITIILGVIILLRVFT
ncbi:MAG: hypothetical protein DRJ57_02025 [Thermoprotei archaeon]|nr:MAG: hypothetical protein DRJ57_02025 [Thermoprotei archaeon]